MMTAADFIDGKGGPAKVGRETGHRPGNVALWRHRNKLPRAAWPEIMEAYPDVSLAALKKIEAASAPARRKAAA